MLGRIAIDIHHPSTIENVYWKKEFPRVVSKVEEVLYSSARSRDDYLREDNLKSRINDAIDSIIGRSEEGDREMNGVKMLPCVEATIALTSQAASGLSKPFLHFSLFFFFFLHSRFFFSFFSYFCSFFLFFFLHSRFFSHFFHIFAHFFSYFSFFASAAALALTSQAASGLSKPAQKVLPIPPSSADHSGSAAPKPHAHPQPNSVNEKSTNSHELPHHRIEGPPPPSSSNSTSSKPKLQFDLILDLNTTNNNDNMNDNNSNNNNNVNNSNNNYKNNDNNIHSSDRDFAKTDRDLRASHSAFALRESENTAAVVAAGAGAGEGEGEGEEGAGAGAVTPHLGERNEDSLFGFQRSRTTRPAVFQTSGLVLNALRSTRLEWVREAESSPEPEKQAARNSGRAGWPRSDVEEI